MKEDRRKRLCDLVEIEENNSDCVLLKVKENAKLDLIKLGCFEGNETMIRVTKGADNTFTIFTDESSYSWYHGESGYTLVSKSMDKKRFLILDCIEIDFDIYVGKNPTLIENSLDIHSIEDTYNKSYDIKIMYWKKEKNTNVIVHKNGEFFRHFNGLEDAKNALEKYNYELQFKGDYIAQTGCIVEEYTMTKREKMQRKNCENEIDNNNEIDYDFN